MNGWCSMTQKIQHILFSYFFDLFSPEGVFFHWWSALQVTLVLSNAILDLCKLPYANEIEYNVKTMNLWKIPGPD